MEEPYEITADNYALWLRAQRPPFEFFFGLSTLEQEALARVGDEYQQDVCLAIGHALRDPVAAELGAKAAGGDKSAEATLLDRLARASGAKIPTPPPRPTMGGFRDRQAMREHKRREKRAKGASFLGAPPEPIEAPAAELAS